jgi:hypothetical protein
MLPATVIRRLEALTTISYQFAIYRRKNSRFPAFFQSLNLFFSKLRPIVQRINGRECGPSFSVC